VYSDSGDVVASEIDFASVQTGADLESRGSQGVVQRDGAANCPTRTVEGRQDALACCPDEPAAVLLHDRSSQDILGLDIARPMPLTSCET
jgi:hypothetical protein